jgi:hypothetical protein
MYRYYRVWCSRQAEIEDPMAIDFQQKMSYGHFRAAWYSFMSLLDIQYEEGFQCPHCGPAPSVVVGDATTLAYRQCYDSWTKAVSCTEDKTEYVSQPIVHGSSYSQRVFLEDAKTRKLLRKFCKNVENTDFTSLPALLLVCPPLCRILEKYGTPSLGDAPQGLRMFLLELSSSSSVCAWIPPSGRSVLVLDKIINGMAIRGDALDMKMLQEDMPIIFRLITDVPIDADIIEILKRLKQVSQQPFKQHTQMPLECSTEKNMDVAYFPSLPVVRRRGIYTIDRKQKPDGCRKNSSRHPTLLPGIFTLFCQHGICYGFQVMRNNESPEVPFTLLMTRFRKAPQTVIYDNACNLAEYALNRCPPHFKDTKFFVDRFHWDNHTACSEGYNIGLYPQFSSVNTEVVEQANSDFNHIKASLSYMTKSNFLNHLRLFVYFRNRNRLNKLY